MDHDQIAQRVVRLIEGRVASPSHRERITIDIPLLTSGLGLDSVTVLDLLMEIEEEFGVVFHDEDLSAELFRNACSLARAVQRKLDSLSSDPPKRARA